MTYNLSYLTRKNNEFSYWFSVDLNSPEESFIVLVSLEKATEHRLLVKNQYGLYACTQVCLGLALVPILFGKRCAGNIASNLFYR